MSAYSLPKINNAYEFEDLITNIYEIKYGNAKKIGVSGQAQIGIDVYSYIANKQMIGIQCKVKDKADFSSSFRNKFWGEIISEYSRAIKSYSLKKFILTTTAGRDAELQRREIEFNKNNVVELNILFWEDITDYLYRPEYLPVLKRFYGNMIEVLDNKDFVGKRINIDIGVKDDEWTKSHYELLLGYADRKIMKNGERMYFTNCFFIANLNARKMDTFPAHCHPSDLELVVDSVLDRNLISNWLKSIDICAIINDKTVCDYKFEEVSKWYENYINEIED